MVDGHRFLFTERTDSLGRSSVMPYLPLTLSNVSISTEAIALLDTGVSINVLPYEIGLQLGAVWQELYFYRHELAFEVCPREK